MIRIFSKKISSALNIFPLPSPALIPPYPPNDKKTDVYPNFNKTKTDTLVSDDGYRLLIDVCHATHTIYIDTDMSEYDKLNDLPKFMKTLGCLYPTYTLRH